MVLEVNWVVLKPGVEKRLRLRDHAFVDRVLTDPVWKEPKTVRTLMFRVSMEDGVPVDKVWSVVSGKLAQELSGYLEGRRYRDYEFVVVKDAPGFVPPRLVSVVPI